MSHKISISLSKIAPYVRYANTCDISSYYLQPMKKNFDFEFIYVVSGSAKINYGGKVYSLKEKELMFLEPLVENDMLIEDKFYALCIHFDFFPPLDSYDFQAVSVYLDPHFPDSEKERLSNRPIYIPSDFYIPTITKNTSPELENLFFKCYYSFLQNNNNKLSVIAAKRYLMTIFEKVCTFSDSETHSIFHPIVNQLVDWLSKNYNQHISVQKLAQTHNVSEKYLGTIFKKTTGKSINEFLLDVRIEAAQRLLTGTDMPISEIATTVGFENVYYFSTCFKKHENISPNSYRKSLWH